MVNERLESALAWCKKNRVKQTEQLSLFAKLKKRKKKLDKKSSKKAREESKNGNIKRG